MTNPCEYKCVDTEVGFFCECPADKVLNADGVTCDDRIGGMYKLSKSEFWF